jgi:hypothetical protein
MCPICGGEKIRFDLLMGKWYCVSDGIVGHGWGRDYDSWGE